MIRDRNVTVMPATDRAALVWGALAVTMALAIAIPGSLRGQAARRVSAWTVEACRMEIERRGWRITANESMNTPSHDAWVWFRLATEPEQTSDVMCGDAAQGGVTLSVLSLAEEPGGERADAAGDLIAACATELAERGWTRSGGASRARAGATILVQHIIRNAAGAGGVGHCVYENRPAAGTQGDESSATGSPALVSVSAELVQVTRGVDVACREAFRVLGWTASAIDGRETSARRAHYSVSGRKGRSQLVVCRYDPVGGSVQIEVEK